MIHLPCDPSHPAPGSESGQVGSCRARPLVAGTLGWRRVAAVAVVVATGVAFADVFTVTTTVDGVPGSLRDALGQANGTPGPDTIVFGVAGTFVMSEPLDVTDPVAILGGSAPGYVDHPVVDLDFSLTQADPLRGGSLQVATSEVLITDLCVRNAPEATAGIHLVRGGTNRIERCYLGTDVTGTQARPNGGFGLMIGTSDGNEVRDCVISGNRMGGVLIGQLTVESTGSSHNVVQHCCIGTDATGRVALPNQQDGIALYGNEQQGNVILDCQVSGNGWRGIAVHGNESDSLIDGNRIGTDDRGLFAIPNRQGGVWITSTSTLGSDAPTARVRVSRNLISGNVQSGVVVGEVDNPHGVLDTLIEGNRIGTDITGEVALPNTWDGIGLVWASRTRVGGHALPANAGDDPVGNVISGNGLNGIRFSGGLGLSDSDSTGTLIQGNNIGVDARGSTVLPNGEYGIYVAGSIDTRIGGPPPFDNLIAGNGLSGIWLDGRAVPVTQAVIDSNSIGVDRARTRPLPNRYDGILATQLGGTVSPAVVEGNFVGGNGGSGINLDGCTNLVVRGNFVGANVASAADLGNQFDGISLHDGTTNRIELNVVGGNRRRGIVVWSTQATPGLHRIVGNSLGVLTTPLQEAIIRPNGGDGIAVFDTPNVLIGGVDAANLIGRNQGAGIYVSGSRWPVSGTVIAGNLIGTDARGEARLGNAGPGIWLDRATDVTVGGTGAEGNTIGDNAGPGVRLAGGQRHRVAGNLIGNRKEQTQPPGNRGSGVSLEDGSAHVIGPGNQIAGNGAEGVLIDGAEASDHAIRSNRIERNEGDGIRVMDGVRLTIGAPVPVVNDALGNEIRDNVGRGVGVARDVLTTTIRLNRIFGNQAGGIDLRLDGPTWNDRPDADEVPNSPQGLGLRQRRDLGVWQISGRAPVARPERAFVDVYGVIPTGEDGEAYQYLGSARPGPTGRFCFQVGATSPEGMPHFVGTVTDEHGTTSELSPINEMKLVAMEAVQSVQDATNTVLLVEQKPTLVRAYVEPLVEAGFGARSISRGMACLRAFQNGAELEPLWPRREPGGEGDQLDVFPDRMDVRHRASASLNFELPTNWLSGTLEMWLDLRKAAGLEEPISGNAPDGCDDGGVTLTFQPGVRLPLALVGMTWTEGTVVRQAPGNYGWLANLITSAFPITGVDWFGVNATWANANPPHLGDLNPTLALLRGTSQLPGRGRAAIWLNLVPDPIAQPDPRGISGKTLGIPGNLSSVYVDLYGFPYTFVTPLHELGHALGRQHPRYHLDRGVCGEYLDTNISVFPHFYEMGAGLRATLGPMDKGGARMMMGWEKHTPQILDPFQSFELMSYCYGPGPLGGRWLSDYTYTNLYTHILQRFGAGRRNATALQDAGPPAEYWFIRGSLDADATAVSWQPWFRVELAEPPEMPPAGEGLIRCLDASGRVLAEVSFAPSFPPREGAEPERGSFLVPVSGVRECRTVELWYRGRRVAVRAASAHAPTVQMRFPRGGEVSLPESFEVAWEANDPDGDRLSYLVQMSRDDGASWVGLAADLEEPRLRFDTRQHPGSRNARFRVFASDGFDTAVSGLARAVALPLHPPEPMVILPATGTRIAGGYSVTFEGVAYDPEDGPLRGGWLTWSSDLQGLLGTGEHLVVNARSLAEGTHRITLTATDSDGESRSSAITLTIGHAMAPTVLAPVAGVEGLKFSVLGEPGQRVRVDRSTNLVAWTPVRTNSLNEGRWEFADRMEEGVPVRFYRVRSKP